MAYQLKTTGIAANVRFMIFNDEGTIRHVAPGNLTGYAGVTVGANVDVSTTSTWAGVSRYTWNPGSGTADADFIKFTSNKPNWTFSTASQQRSIVWILESPASNVTPICFGKQDSISFNLRNQASGGSTMPSASTIGVENVINGNGSMSTSTKYIVALTATHGSSFQLWYGTDGGSITDATESASPTWYTGSLADYDLDYVNRTNTYGEAHRQHKNFAIIAFDDDLNSTELGSLLTDWFGTLLESATSASVNHRRLMMGIG